MLGCEPHSENWGGTILLTRQAQKWTSLWYKPGIDTAECHKIRLRDKREILVCLTGGGTQGFLTTRLYVEDLRDPKPAGMAGDESVLFFLTDTTGTCGENYEDESKPQPLQYAYIERVEFKDNKADPFYLSVTAHSGQRKMTLQDVEDCNNELNPTKPHKGLSFLPPTKREQIDFVFEGGTYHRSPAATDRK